jgi:hypothetical protein
MGSFGNAGIRTVKTSLGFVKVDLNSEHLHYFIKAKGATPIFNLSCKHRTLWSERDFGPPAMNYERVWPKEAGEVDAPEDEYSVSISFFAATDYSLRVERHDSAHEVLELVKDVDYTSTDSQDLFVEAFRVQT